MLNLGEVELYYRTRKHVESLHMLIKLLIEFELFHIAKNCDTVE